MACSKCKSESTHEKIICEDNTMVFYICICNICGYEESKVRYKIYYN
jgi:hypothetical protein